MATAPELTATPSGDVLELRPAGSWTATNVTMLEALSNGVAPQLDRSKAIKLDLAGLRELDTLGAWLLEKLSRRASAAGHPVEVVGVDDNYAGLIEEVRQVNRRNPAPAPALNPVVAKVNEKYCVGCLACKKVCAYGAVEEKEIRDRQGNLVKVVAYVNPGVCGGCGTCQATCPSKSVELDGYTDEQIMAMIEAL